MRVFWRPPAPLSAGGVCGWAERGARCVGCAGQDPRLLGCVCAWVPLVMGVGSKGGSGQDPRLLGCGCAWAASCVTPTLPLELCLHGCHRLRCSGCCPRCCCCSAVAAGSARQLVHTACTILTCHCLPATPAERVRSGEWLGATGKPLTDVVSLAAWVALRGWRQPCCLHFKQRGSSCRWARARPWSGVRALCSHTLSPVHVAVGSSAPHRPALPRKLPAACG